MIFNETGNDGGGFLLMANWLRKHALARSGARWLAAGSGAGSALREFISGI
jgi:hypothetical protein